MKIQIILPLDCPNCNIKLPIWEKIREPYTIQNGDEIVDYRCPKCSYKVKVYSKFPRRSNSNLSATDSTSDIVTFSIKKRQIQEYNQLFVDPYTLKYLFCLVAKEYFANYKSFIANYQDIILWLKKRCRKGGNYEHKNNNTLNELIEKLETIKDESTYGRNCVICGNIVSEGVICENCYTEYTQNNIRKFDKMLPISQLSISGLHLDKIVGHTEDIDLQQRDRLKALISHFSLPDGQIMWAENTQESLILIYDSQIIQYHYAPNLDYKYNYTYRKRIDYTYDVYIRKCNYYTEVGNAENNIIKFYSLTAEEMKDLLPRNVKKAHLLNENEEFPKNEQFKREIYENTSNTHSTQKSVSSVVSTCEHKWYDVNVIHETGEQSYSFKKGLAGALVFGPVGAVAGINGKTSSKYSIEKRCKSCGYTWRE